MKLLRSHLHGSRLHWPCLTALLLSPALAQTASPAALAPAGTPGETYLAPLGVLITLDGKFDDWAGVPRVTVTGGPMPAKSPTEDGSLTFAAAADDKYLYLLATVPSANIVAGKHGTEYYKEDSVEFYLNVGGDLGRKAYSPQVVQINFPAAGIDRPEGDPLIGGSGAGLGIRAKVVRTPDGYALEAAVPHQNARWNLTPAHGGTIGFQAQLNGASVLDRDTKLIWSKADTNDQSYANPSLFGKLTFFKVGEAGLPAAENILTASGPAAAPAAALPPISAPVQAAITALNLPARLAPAHPRLLANASDFERLKALIASDPAAKAMFTRIEADAKGMLGAPVSKHTLAGVEALLAISRQVLTRAYTLGLAYRLTGNADYAKRLYAELEAAAAFPDWSHQKHFLSTAEMAHAFAIGYDWTYDALTPEQRKVIVGAIDKHAFGPAISGYRGRMDGDAFWVTAESNWGIVTHGGLGVAALAVGDELPERAGEVLANALNNVKPALAGYLPDGGYAEGTDYWAYATKYAVALLGSLQSALGNDAGLLATAPGLPRTGDFVVQLAGPQFSFNYSDFPHPGTRVSGPELRWLAQTFSRPEWAAYQGSFGGASPLDLLWYRPATAGATAAAPLDKVFPETGVAVMRSSWNDPFGTFAGLKVGSNQAGHNDLDLGTFVFDALGTRWAADLGRENYNVPGYWEYQPGGKRWMYYRKRAEGQNTLVINPGARDDQDARATARITRSGSSAGEAFAVTDLSAAYAGAGARKVERGLMLLDGRRQLLVQDEVELNAPGELWWFMHTSARAEVAPDGQSATLYRGTRRLSVRLLSPAGAKLALMPAAPLPTSPRMEAANANTGFRKLAVQLKGFQSGRVAVLLTPLRPGETVTAPPAVTALAAWKTPGTPAAVALSALTVDGQPLAGFAANRFSYDVTLPSTAARPPVVATSTPGARVTQAAALPGTARVCPPTGPCTTVSFWHSPAAPAADAAPLKVVAAKASAEQNPNVAASAIDGDPQTRWAAEGPGQWLELDLGEARTLAGAGLRLGGSDVRLTTFDLLTSTDGQQWTLTYSGENALGNPDLQRYGFAPVQARYLRLVAYGNTVNDWNNVHEVQVYGR